MIVNVNFFKLCCNTAHQALFFIVRRHKKLREASVKFGNFFCCLLATLSLLLFTGLSYGSEPYLNFAFGVGLAKIGTSQNYSPINGLINYYSSNSDTKIIAPLISLGAGYRFNINNKYYTSLGIEGDYIDYGNSKGTLHPGVNIDPGFDDLSYSYSAESYLLMLKSEWGFTDHAWLPYISLGIGLSFNQLGDYSESSNNSAAPAQILYTRDTKEDMAYSFSLGLYRYKIRNDISLSLGYRFIYAGNAALRNPVIGSDSISSGLLSGHFISLILSVS